jgi:steroid 5-alpha reductase family enzyme
VGVVYVLAIAAAWLVWYELPFSPPVALFAGLGAASAVAYLAILHADNGSVFDAWWSVLPPFAALWLTGLSGADSPTPRQVAVHAVVWFWAIRLTTNWARDWPGLAHEDWRYVGFAERLPLPKWAVRLIVVVALPTLIVALGCLPLVPALGLGDTSFHGIDGLALGVGLAATAIALVADEQMRSFARDKQPGDLMDRGLWGLSRHPNYLGEIGFWSSLWLFGLSASPAEWWTGLGALAIILMFVFGSIPMLDGRSAERRPGFAAYAERTPALVPWPRRRTGGGAA